MTKLSKINLRVSELSSIVGYNPYSDIKPIILRLWQKADQRNYFETIVHLVQENIIDNPLIRDEDVIQTYSKKYDINLFNGLNTKIECSDELEKHKQQLLTNIDNNTQIEQTDKTKIKDSLEGLLQTNYGIRHEDFAIQEYCKQFKVNVTQQQKYIKKMIAQSTTFEWYITGKVDGIREDNILIEIKNRIHRLGGTLKPYENIQVQIYLHLFGLKKSHLVESIKRKNKREINVIEVDYDKDKWNEIKLKINRFLEFFYHFISSDELKHYFLTKSDTEINQYYKSMINAEIIE